MSIISSGDLSLAAFQQTLLSQPLELFAKISQHKCFETGLYALLLTLLIRQTEQSPSIGAEYTTKTLAKIRCLAELFIVEHAPLALNVRKSDLNIANIDHYFDKLFATKPSNGQYIYKSDLVASAETVADALYLFKQILLCLYLDKLQNIFKRYMLQTQVPEPDGGRTPRFFDSSASYSYTANIEQCLQKRILNHLAKADFTTEGSRLASFDQLFAQPWPAAEPNHPQQASRCAPCAIL